MLEDIFREAYSGIISKLDRAAIDGYDALIREARTSNQAFIEFYFIVIAFAWK